MTANYLTGLLPFIKKSKVVVHQQDPMPGLANRFAIKFADIKSCLFEYTKQKYKNFQNSILIPNPIDQKKYLKSESEHKSILVDTYPDLEKFLDSKEPPILLVFGGGSGSLDINNWLLNNLFGLLSKFKIIHIKGALQEELQYPKHENLYQFQSVNKAMPSLLAVSDFILCRAGLGSISELRILNKKAFLVPLPHSHQELNAELIKDEFIILKQSEMDNWLNIIEDNIDNYSHKINLFADTNSKALNNYKDSILNCLND